jgi:Protein of unknown function (DUF4199)
MPTEDNINKQLRINAIIKGVILGVVLLASGIFSYYLITAFTKTSWLIITGPYFFSILVPIILTSFFCIDMRKKLGGYWGFKQSVTAIFIMFMVCYGILTIGRDLVFAKLIEPNMAQKTQAVMINVRAEQLKIAGASQTEINNQLTELKKEFNTYPGVFSIVQDYITNIIFLFAIAVVFAAIFKKEPPYTVEIVTEEVVE